jgi:putative colanic acid biosynthesis acetyltransferase WcaF
LHESITKYQELSRFELPLGFRGRPGWYVQLWWLVQSCLFRPSPQWCYAWRRLLLRLFGAKVGVGVLVRPSAIITYPWKVALGDYVWIGDDVVLYSLGPIVIGNNAVVSQRCYLCCGSHDVESVSFAICSDPVVIEDEVWLALDVTVLPGATIGRGAVVGARSTVVKSLAGGWVYLGSPAKAVRRRRPL